MKNRFKYILLILFTGLISNHIQAQGTMWLHLLTTGSRIYTTGSSYNIQFEVNQTSWASTNVGYGKSSANQIGWTWVGAFYYENGTGDNRHVQADLGSITPGTYYYTARAEKVAFDGYVYSSDAAWTNSTTFSTNSAQKLIVNNATTAYHFITIDASLTDWRSNENFDGLTDGYNGEHNNLYFTWGDEYLYIGLNKISAWGNNDNLILYLDVDGNSSNGGNLGITINGNTPTLPFNYDYVVFLRPTGTAYYDIRSYTNRNTTMNQGGTILTSYSSNKLEAGVPFSGIGNPTSTVRAFTYMNVDNANTIFTTWPSTGHDISGSADGGIDFSTGGTLRWFSFSVTNNTTPNGEGVLPVELTSFSASVKNKSVNLVWHTATEVNNYGFEIQKSIRNEELGIRNWNKVGFVNGSGNSNSPKDYSYTDKTAASGKYTYRLKQIDNDGKYEYSKEVEVDLGKPTTFALNQNYPNPFNPSTSIQYSVVGSQYVSLKVFNVLGKEVASLVNEKQEPGIYTVDFSAANLSGGAYFYRLQAGEFMQTKKMILLK